MRCLALAQAWQGSGGCSAFAMINPPPALSDKLLQQSFEIFQIAASPGDLEDAKRTAEIAGKQDASWIVVDGYHFEGDYQQALKSARTKVLFLDDAGHAQHYAADVVLNQNICAAESIYSNRAPYTRLLLGPRFCLLRKEFVAWRKWKREIAPVACRVLVTMGGSDPQKLSERAIRALSQIQSPAVEAAVVAGSSNPDYESLKSLAARSGRNITVHRDVPNMPELMAWADVAISAAGTTTWEMCLMGLPAVLITAAENQIQIAQELARRECAIYLGDASNIQPEQISYALQSLLADRKRRQFISSNCGQIVDGRGAERVVQELLVIESAAKSAFPDL